MEIIHKLLLSLFLVIVDKTVYAPREPIVNVSLSYCNNLLGIYSCAFGVAGVRSLFLIVLLRYVRQLFVRTYL